MMKPERWRQIKAVFEEAVHRAPVERQPLLDRMCAGDRLLRVEVDAMLAADDQADSFIEAPAAEVVPELFGEPTPVTRIGSQLGEYVILSRLGTGGMGEVYLAEDRRLGRKVALKLLVALQGDSAIGTGLINLRDRPELGGQHRAQPSTSSCLTGPLSLRSSRIADLPPRLPARPPAAAPLPRVAAHEHAIGVLQRIASHLISVALR